MISGQKEQISYRKKLHFCSHLSCSVRSKWQKCFVTKCLIYASPEVKAKLSNRSYFIWSTQITYFNVYSGNDSICFVSCVPECIS